MFANLLGCISHYKVAHCKVDTRVTCSIVKKGILSYAKPDYDEMRTEHVFTYFFSNPELLRDCGPQAQSYSDNIFVLHLTVDFVSE